MLKVAGGGGGGTAGAVAYQGTWNASTNNPTLTSGVGTKGNYYVVSTAGTTTLDGISLWSVGDWAVFNGTVWQKVNGSTNEAFGNITVTSLTGYMYANNTSPVTASTTIPVANVSGAVANTTYVLAGTGLSGGGALTGNVTLTNAGVTAFNTRTGNVTLSSSDVTTALGYTPGTGNGTVTSVATGTGLSGGPITGSGTISIANTTVTAATYGLANSVSQVTFNAQGQATSASNVLISIANTQVTGLGTMATQNANAVTITGGTADNVSIGATTPANAVFIQATANNGFYSKSTFGGSYTDGIVVDYVTGNGRFSVGTNDQFTWYNGGVANVALANLSVTGVYSASALNATNGLVINNQTVATSYTVPVGSSAMSAGPMTINNGVTVTVSSGSRWVVL